MSCFVFSHSFVSFLAAFGLSYATMRMQQCEDAVSLKGNCLVSFNKGHISIFRNGGAILQYVLTQARRVNWLLNVQIYWITSSKSLKNASGFNINCINFIRISHPCFAFTAIALPHLNYTRGSLCFQSKITAPLHVGAALWYLKVDQAWNECMQFSINRILIKLVSVIWVFKTFTDHRSEMILQSLLMNILIKTGTYGVK